jgi:hypothetical protein
VLEKPYRYCGVPGIPGNLIPGWHMPAGNNH